jgi:hypothetical protein
VPTLPTPIQHSFGIPSQSNKAGRSQFGEEAVKLSLFSDDMILYLKTPKNSTQKLPDTIHSFRKVARYKISLQKSVAFLINNNEQIEKEYRKRIPFTISSKKKKSNT